MTRLIDALRRAIDGACRRWCDRDPEECHDDNWAADMSHEDH